MRKDINDMSFGSTPTNEPASGSSPKSVKKPAAKDTKVVTFVDVAKDLALLEHRQVKQRTELATTDALIAEKQKELSTLVSGIGRRK